MPQSLTTFSIRSTIYFSPTSLENSIDKELKCFVEWRRIFPHHCKTNIFRDQILYSSRPVDYQEIITYKCNPFDYRSIIMARLFQIQKIDNNQKGVTENKIQIDEISFGPIQGPSSLQGKLDLEKVEQIQIILNKTCYKNTEFTVMKRMNGDAVQGMNMKIKTDGNQLNINFNKEELEAEQFPIKVYDKDDSVIGFYVYHQYHQFMGFLRKLNVCCHYGKYLKVNCKNQEHRNQILFKIFCCFDNSIAGDFLKSTQNPESKLTINCKSAYDYLNVNSRQQIIGDDSNLMLMNTFGNNKCPSYNYCSSSESGYEPIDSPYFNNYKNNKVKTEEKCQSQHHKGSEPIQKPPQVPKDSKSINEEIDNLLGEESDDFYLSPSEHMIEDIYKILYTPYSKEQKDRKQSFSDINEFCLKDSVSNTNNFQKKQSKNSLKFQEDLIKPKKFRETLDVKKNNYFQTKAEEPLRPLMKIVLEQPPSKSQAYSQKESLNPGLHKVQQLSQQHLSNKSILGTFKAHSLSPQQVHNLNRRESFLREKIDHLTKINQQLMRQNVHLKSIIKFERQKKEKLDLIKMNEIKEMALMMVKRLEHVQYQNSQKDAYAFQDEVGKIVEKKYNDLQKQKESSNRLFYKPSRSPTQIPKLLPPKPLQVYQTKDAVRKLSENKSLNSSKSAHEERSKNHLITRPQQGKMRKYGSNYMERKEDRSESGSKIERRKDSQQKVLNLPIGPIGNINDKKYEIPKFLRNRTSQGSYNLVFEEKNKHGQHGRNAEYQQNAGNRGNFGHKCYKGSYDNSQKSGGMRKSNTIIKQMANFPGTLSHQHH